MIIILNCLWGRGGSNPCDLTSSGLPAPSFFYTREK
nr:MAG TPA: hypothetical protein [Caudoviricetes sp.]